MEEVSRLCSFLNRTVDDSDKRCLQKYGEGSFHRQHRINEDIFSYFPSDMKQELDSQIKNISEVIHKRFPNINLPWSLHNPE